jgi:hypothetical protein
MATNPEIIKNKIMMGINRNTYIHDASHLSFQIKTSGFMFWKTTELIVSGRVDTEKEKAEIDRILDEESQGLKIVNNLRVEKR